MSLPIRNRASAPLRLIVEPNSDEYELPVGGETIVTLEDGRPHSIEYHADNVVFLYDEGTNLEAIVEIYLDQAIGRR